MKQKLIDFYLDFINDYLTIDKFAEDNGLTKDQAVDLLEIGRKFQDQAIEDANITIC